MSNAVIQENGFTGRLFRLDGRVAVVAGGAGRIGRTLCAALADAGASVCVLDNNESAATEVAREVADRSGQRVVAAVADLSCPRNLAEAAKRIEADLGPASVLVNSAQFRGQGFYSSCPEDYPLEAWNQVIGLNLTAVFLACQAFGRQMIRSGGGSIVNISSTYGVCSADPRIYGDSGVNSPISYAASKSAILNLTRYLAVHWRAQAIRVNCLVPGGVYDGQADEFVKAYRERTPLDRMATAADYQGAVLFMASDASSYMTGSIVTVDGGWTAW